MTQKTFIFDLDGVIVDTAKYHFLAWQKLANELGISFTHEDNEQLKGVSRVASLELILKWGNKEISQEDKEKYLIQKNENYLAYIENIDASEILPGVQDVLNYLKNNHQNIVLGSASKNARPILEKTGVLHFFDAIIDGNDVSKAKPDPEVFLLGAKNVNANSNDCIVFEDSVAGIQAANIAGMISIGIGDEKTLHEAKFRFKDFDEITIDFIKELMGGVGA
ncbi:MAG: beta-phosphoglucomutase [Flavobacterium sp.]